MRSVKLISVLAAAAMLIPSAGFCTQAAASSQILAAKPSGVYTVKKSPYGFNATAAVSVTLKGSRNQASGYRMSKGSSVCVINVVRVNKTSLYEAVYKTGAKYIHGYVPMGTLKFRYQSWYRSINRQPVYSLGGKTKVAYLNKNQRATELYMSGKRCVVLFNTKNGSNTGIGLVNYRGSWLKSSAKTYKTAQTKSSSKSYKKNKTSKATTSTGTVVSKYAGKVYTVKKMPYNYNAVAAVSAALNGSNNKASGYKMSKGSKVCVVNVVNAKKTILYEIVYKAGSKYMHGYVAAGTLKFRYQSWYKSINRQPVYSLGGKTKVAYLNKNQQATKLFMSGNKCVVLFNTKNGSNTGIGLVNFKGKKF